MRNLSILLVDDDQVSLSMLKSFAKNIGFQEITETSNGKHAYDLLLEKEAPFDVIVSDWNMPGMTGIELLKKVRSLPVHEKTKFVMSTSEASVLFVKAAMQAGVSEYMIKPFNPKIALLKMTPPRKKKDQIDDEIVIEI